MKAVKPVKRPINERFKDTIPKFNCALYIYHTVNIPSEHLTMCLLGVSVRVQPLLPAATLHHKHLGPGGRQPPPRACAGRCRGQGGGRGENTRNAAAAGQRGRNQPGEGSVRHFLS